MAETESVLRSQLVAGADPGVLFSSLVTEHGREEASRLWQQVFAAYDAAAQT